MASIRRSARRVGSARSDFSHRSRTSSWWRRTRARAIVFVVGSERDRSTPSARTTFSVSCSTFTPAANRSTMLVASSMRVSLVADLLHSSRPRSVASRRALSVPLDGAELDRGALGVGEVGAPGGVDLRFLGLPDLADGAGVDLRVAPPAERAALVRRRGPARTGTRRPSVPCASPTPTSWPAAQRADVSRPASIAPTRSRSRRVRRAPDERHPLGAVVADGCRALEGRGRARGQVVRDAAVLLRRGADHHLPDRRLVRLHGGADVLGLGRDRLDDRGPEPAVDRGEQRRLDAGALLEQLHAAGPGLVVDAAAHVREERRQEPLGHEVDELLARVGDGDGRRARERAPADEGGMALLEQPGVVHELVEQRDRPAGAQRARGQVRDRGLADEVGGEPRDALGQRAVVRHVGRSVEQEGRLHGRRRQHDLERAGARRAARVLVRRRLALGGRGVLGVDQVPEVGQRADRVERPVLALRRREDVVERARQQDQRHDHERRPAELRRRPRGRSGA